MEQDHLSHLALLCVERAQLLCVERAQLLCVERAQLLCVVIMYTE